VEDSVILGHAVIQEGAKVRRAIIDHGNLIARGEEIGYNQERDMSRYHVDESGIVVTHRQDYEHMT
jgi:ADP-glucose pyrophosphorylase